MPLTIKAVKHATPGRHSDGNGLYLLVKPLSAEQPHLPGAKSWVLRVQSDIGGKRDRRDFGLGAVTLESLGDIPLHKRKLLTLAEARDKAALGRALAKAGINPSVAWRQDQEAPTVPTFRTVAEEAHKHRKAGWRNVKHRKEWLDSLDRYAFPVIGDMSVDEVDASAIQRVLLPFWLTKPETARRVKQRIGAVLDYAHAHHWRQLEAPMRAVNQLMRAIKQPKEGHFSAVPYRDLPALLETLRTSEQSVGRWALQFQILTAARPGEVRHAQWKDIDLDAAEWRVPAEKAKADKLHIVPLVSAAVDILKELRGLFAPKSDDYVFPGFKGKPISDATMNKVLRVAGWQGFTVHGFRSSFRDWAADNGFPDSWAEAALAHLNPNKTEAAWLLCSPSLAPSGDGRI